MSKKRPLTQTHRTRERFHCYPLCSLPSPSCSLQSPYQSACCGEHFPPLSCLLQLLTRTIPCWSNLKQTLREPARDSGRRCSMTSVCSLAFPPSGALEAPFAFCLTLHSTSSRAPACHAIAAKPHSGLVLRRSAEFILAEQQVKYLADLCLDSSCSGGVRG